MNNSKRSKNMKTIASKLENTNKVHFEGQLYKFTNVVKGWQFRWFVLRPEFGRLDYYLVEERGVTNLIGVSNETMFSKPRGSGHLRGCTVVPSEEDGRTFTIYFSNSDHFKLRAFNARERQIWVDKIRTGAELWSNPTRTRTISQCTEVGLEAKEDISPRVETSRSFSSSSLPNPALRYSHFLSPSRQNSVNKSLPPKFRSLEALDDQIQRCQVESQKLCHMLENDVPDPREPDLLILKALLNSTVKSLGQSFQMLEKLNNEAVTSEKNVVISNSSSEFPSPLGNLLPMNGLLF